METLLQEMAGESGLELPASLAGLEKRPLRHERLIEKDAMKETVRQLLTM